MSIEDDFVTNSECAWCKRLNHFHRGVNTDERPDEGSVSMCWSCREPSVFTADGVTLRKPTDEEYASICEDDEVKAIRYAMTESVGPAQVKPMFEEMTHARPE